MSAISRSEVFCDKFTVTAPFDNEQLIVENFSEFFQGFFAERANESCYRSASGGSLTWGRRGGVSWFTTSGSFLADLRASRVLNDYLLCFASHPDNPLLEHRVSLLDVTVDEYTYAPPRLQSVYARALAGDISFTRKSLSPTSVSRHESVCAYNDTFDNTGTVYLGSHTAKVRAKVYDKRQQMLVMKQKEIPDTLRHELTVTGAMGVSLHDIAAPAALFYNFYSANLLAPPSSPVTAWIPSEVGYKVVRHEAMPAMRLQARMKGSHELQAMFKLASLSGEKGFDYFVQVARELYKLHEAQFTSISS